MVSLAKAQYLGIVINAVVGLNDNFTYESLQLLLWNLLFPIHFDFVENL